MITIIQAIVESLTGPPSFFHGKREYQNIDADKADLKDGIVYLDEPIVSEDTIHQSGYVEETYPLRLLFLKKSDLKWTPAEHQVVISEMRTLRREFISKLQAHASVRDQGSMTTTDLMNILDANLSGVLLEIEVILFNTDPNC